MGKIRDPLGLESVTLVEKTHSRKRNIGRKRGQDSVTKILGRREDS